MSAADIAAVVVTHQSASTIDACLSRLRSANGIAQIRVVDNGSDDGTMDIVQRHAASDVRLHFIANPDNPGFSVACNQGAADSDAEFLAFVNPDLLVEADTLIRLRDDAVQLVDALIGCDLVNEAGEHDAAARRHDPDFVAMLRSSAARRFTIAREVVTLQQVEAISGALMLLPRQLFQRIGGFDEGYRLHLEDLDLCRQVRLAGGVVAMDNDVVVTHYRGVSSRSRPLFVQWHKHRSMWRYFRKYDAQRHGFLTRAAVFGMIWARFPVAVLKTLVGD